MTPEETKQAAAVMLASETKNIQERYLHGKSDDGWIDCPDPDWDWDSFDYRIAPEPEPSKLVGPFTQMAAGEVGVAFANPHVAIEQLCMKVFGAKPTYTRQSPAPEPMEVEVLYHPATRDFMRSDRLTSEHARQLGWTLRRATIQPETK